MRLVIGYDGSEYARGAVDDLHRSGLPRVATVLVVCVGEMAVPLKLLRLMNMRLDASVHTKRLRPEQ